MDKVRFSELPLERSRAGITELQRELLEELECLGSLTDQDVFLIFLVYLDFKPSAELALAFQEGFPDYTNQDYEEAVEEVRQLLKKMELCYEQKKTLPNSNDDDPTVWTSFYISKSPQIAAKLRQAFSKGDEEAIPRLLGYPESAMHAFPNNSIWTNSSAELRESNVAPFLYFLPSKEHWKSEVKVLDEPIKLLKQLMPKLHDRMLKRYSEVK